MIKSKDTCIVVQGPTIPTDVQNIKNCWNGYNIIFSTWENSDEGCYDENDVVIFNKYPKYRGTMNFHLQQISSLNGFIKAKELGFSRVLKWRNDLVVENPVKFINLLKSECINLYSFQKYHLEGYVTDFFMEGDVDEMIQLFSITENPPYPEFAFTKQLYKLGLDSKTNFICKKLKRNVVDIFWRKRNYWLSQNSKYEGYADKLPETMHINYK